MSCANVHLRPPPLHRATLWEKMLANFCHQLPIRQLVHGFHAHNTVPEFGLLEPLGELALRLTGSHDQHHVGIAERRDDLIVVPVEMFTKTSVAPVFWRASWGMRRKAAMGLHL